MVAAYVNRRLRGATLGICLGLGLLFLSACSAPDVVASLDGKTILTTEGLIEQAKAMDLCLHEGKATLADQTDQDKNRFYKDVARQMMTDALIAKDEALVTNSDKLFADAWSEAVQRFGGEKGLLAQLQNYHISKEYFSDSLRSVARQKAHRTAFYTAHPVTEDAVKAYFEKHKKESALLTYSQVTVPTRSEAKEIVQKLKNSPKEIAEYESVVNNDLFEQTTFHRYTDIGYDDPDVVDTDIFTQPLGSVAFYYDASREIYAVVYLEGRKDAYKDVKKAVQNKVQEQQYLEYLNALAKKYDLRFDVNSVPQQTKR